MGCEIENPVLSNLLILYEKTIEKKGDLYYYFEYKNFK